MKYLLSFILFCSIVTYGQTAEDYFKKGLSKSNLKDYKGAISEFSQAIELDSNYAKSYEHRGYAKNNLQDYNGAKSEYNKAIKLGANRAYVY